MSDVFPIQIRRPFDTSGQVSPPVPVYDGNRIPFAYPVWPTGGSTFGPSLQPPTAIPLFVESAAVIETGTTPMLVTQSGMEAQYRLATGAVTLYIESQSRQLGTTEFLLINAQLVANLYGSATVLANSYPDMAIAGGTGFDPTPNSRSLAQKNIVFPALTAPVGTVANTIGMRIIMLIIDSQAEREPREPFTLVYSLSGSVAVADPVAGPCANY